MARSYAAPSKDEIRKADRRQRFVWAATIFLSLTLASMSAVSILSYVVRNDTAFLKLGALFFILTTLFAAMIPPRPGSFRIPNGREDVALPPSRRQQTGMRIAFPAYTALCALGAINSFADGLNWWNVPIRVNGSSPIVFFSIGAIAFLCISVFYEMTARNVNVHKGVNHLDSRGVGAVHIRSREHIPWLSIKSIRIDGGRVEIEGAGARIRDSGYAQPRSQDEGERGDIRFSIPALSIGVRFADLITAIEDRIESAS
ncbi:MAG: hypothetical protein QM662_12570 [Gordonia sp. (in: high G+C Gram-positive bacteria)]